MFVIVNILKIICTYFFLSLILCGHLISQDLTRQEPIEKVVIFKGESGHSHYYEPNELTFETGKLYRLILNNESDSKHYFSSNSFSKSVFTRKIQINYNGKKLSEVKGVINEVEVWPNNQIECYFFA